MYQGTGPAMPITTFGGSGSVSVSPMAQPTKQYDLDRIGGIVSDLTLRAHNSAESLRCVADRLYGSLPTAADAGQANKPYGTLADLGERVQRLAMAIELVEAEARRLGNI